LNTQSVNWYKDEGMAEFKFGLEEYLTAWFKVVLPSPLTPVLQ
jgi:hypothetical protein